MNTKYIYVNTIGCQMNVYDSEQMIKVLKPLGYERTLSLETADLIIVNTCSIRKKAEQKAFSFLGRLPDLKKKKAGLIIGISGCVAQQEGKKILDRFPYVDIILGTHAIGRLPQLVNQIEKERCRIVDIKMSEEMEELECANRFHSGDVSSFVTIMQGCDNFCTYCVVPYVRGRERSRAPENIIQEICGLVASGTKEVTLLGQNVNSYGKKEGLCSFPELLGRVNDIEGLLRIRFTTSHPKDLSDELVYAFKDLEKVCGHFHLPVQCGSNRILKKMNRKYTRESYLERVDKLRQVRPDIAITSDMIVGFPGETRADFEETLDLIKKVEFDGLFAFIYSERPNAPASAFPDQIDLKEKKERLQKLLDLQEGFTKKKNEALVGKSEFVLVEGLSKKQNEPGSEDRLHDFQLTGRTSGNKIVNFVGDDTGVCGNDVFTGRIVNVRIEKAFAHSLWGKALKSDFPCHGLKGDATYAA